MKQSFYIYLLVLIISFSISDCLVQIELIKHMAKFHHQYLKALKFTQVSSKSTIYSSFLEEKDVPLHQQV